MTENEAREVESILRQLSEDENIDSYCTESLKSFADDGVNTIEFLLEELQRQKDYIDTISEVCSGYSAIGTIEDFKALKEKSEPKKPFQPFGTHSYKCPSCWKFVAHEVDDNCDLEAEMAGWCPYCGQKLDWQ